MFYQFGELLADVPAFNNPGLVNAKNVIPYGNSYESFPAQVVYSNALTARCQGAISVKDNTGVTANFAGDATKLYKSTAGSFADVSVVGGYSVDPEDNWHFTRYGSRVIATNIADYPQTFTLNSSAAFSNLTTLVKARYCATIRNFLFLANTYDATDGTVPHRVRWSALDDPTSFSVSATTQSDYQDLDPSNGYITGIISGEYGIIFQERAITRVTYVGSPTVFQFDTIETGRGSRAEYSIIKVGSNIYFLGNDGFYIFDGARSIPIGENKIDKFFLDNLDNDYLSRIYVCADIDKQVIYWAAPFSGNSGGNANALMCYNYSPNTTTWWTYVDQVDLEFIYKSYSEGYTLDGLDAVNSSIDALPFSLDSRVWMGGASLLSGFDSNHKQVNFTGTSLNSLIETGEFQLTPGQRTNLFRVRPILDGSATITLQIGTRNSLSESVTWTPDLSVDQIGEIQMRENARYFRARLNTSGSFNFSQGIDLLEFTPAGIR